MFQVLAIGLLELVTLGTAAPALALAPSPAPSAGVEVPREKKTEPDAGVHGTKGDANSSARSTPSAEQLGPRLEFHAPSVARLIAEAKRSRSGPFVSVLGRLAVEMGQRTSEGVDVEDLSRLLDQVADWPDTSLDVVTFAPDLLGRPRWAVRVHWPLADAYARLSRLLTVDAGQDLFEGVTLQSRDAGGYAAMLDGQPIAYLLSPGNEEAIVASHEGLVFPKSLFAGDTSDESAPPSLLAVRLNLAGTEKDTGATFFSSLSLLQSVDYVARVDVDGVWQETVRVNWPPIVGMGAKALMGRVRKTFFVPREAFGAAVVSSLTFPSLLENMAGLGQQVFMEQPGQFEIAGDPAPGPISSRASGDLCLTVLPGTGFLPMPDVVVQTRLIDVDTLTAALREATSGINTLFRQRDQKEPWREVTVRDTTVFYRDAVGTSGPVMLPLVMRPVLFSHRESDAKGKDRDYLIVAWTSTSPEALVKRWLDYPRMSDRLYLPRKRKVGGQAWVNWKTLYRWASPYINTAFSSASITTMLPGADALGGDLSDAWLTGKLTYRGLVVRHEGPVPVGVVLLPSMVASSMVMDQSQGSDLARERVASQRLKVLYHHAELFRKDLGRWPVAVAELDGYVDFAGHPELLHLRVSSSHAWSEFFDELFPNAEGKAEKTDEEVEEEEQAEIDDDLYVVHWSPTQWTLGYAPGTFDHLDRLYIDQHGRIVRVAKTEPVGPVEKKQTGDGVQHGDVPAVSPPVTSAEQPAQ